MTIYRMVKGKQIEITEEEQAKELAKKGFVLCKCGRAYYDSKKYSQCLDCVLHPMAEEK
mgnify:FL=1